MNSAQYQFYDRGESFHGITGFEFIPPEKGLARESLSSSHTKPFTVMMERSSENEN
jgi:hypothetical protein